MKGFREKLKNQKYQLADFVYLDWRISLVGLLEIGIMEDRKRPVGKPGCPTPE